MSFKILYAIQSTGNGHIARAQEVIPILQKYATVDLLTSGHQAQLKVGLELTFQLSGVSLLYNKKGGLSYTKILIKNQFLKAFKDIRKIPVENYDLILNDFEPITAWACLFKNVPCLQMSHQAALLYQESPKPKKISWLGKLVLKFYAPTKKKLAFHFQSYHPEILYPVIRKKIRDLRPTYGNHYVVYLPSFSNDVLAKTLQQIPVQWVVFSKHCSRHKRANNIDFYPIDEQNFLQKFESCQGILCNAGFETPSEALFLGKKLFVIPIKNQYEQVCNATALKEMGIDTAKDLNIQLLQTWTKKSNPTPIDYPNQLESLLMAKIISSLQNN